MWWGYVLIMNIKYCIYIILIYWFWYNIYLKVFVNCGIVYIYMFYDNLYLSLVLYGDKVIVMDGYFVILYFN